MTAEKNIAKYESYKSMHKCLTRALNSEFYYEAIFIEYAILEDRLTSLLKYAGIAYQDKKGNDISISQKLNKAESCSVFSTKYVRSRITLELINEIRVWTKARNDLIHHLATLPYDHESVQQLAEEGNRLVKVLSTKVKSVNDHHQKLREGV